MGEKAYRIDLDADSSIFTYFEVEQGKVKAFVVKLISVIEGEEVEILRYDSGHGVPHIDVLKPDGSVAQKIWLPHLDQARALTHAQEDLQRNYQIYLERFIRWRKKN